MYILLAERRLRRRARPEQRFALFGKSVKRFRNISYRFCDISFRFRHVDILCNMFVILNFTLLCNFDLDLVYVFVTFRFVFVIQTFL